MKSCIYIICVSLLSSCSLFDADKPEPMYFNMDEVQLQTTVLQGENTHKIRDVSVYADGFSIGLYPLPANIPVLSEREEVELFIFGVIRNNGIASNPIEYPFYDPVIIVRDVEAFSDNTIDLNFRYSDQTRIIQLGDFETSNTFNVNVDNNPDITFIRSAETPYGNFCGKITITADHPSFEKTTFTKIERGDIAGSPVFLELDYRNDIPFAIGLLRIEPGGFFVPNYKLILTEQNEWNKVYLELTDELNDTQFDQFTILIGSNQSSTGFGSIWIDNVRLVYK